MWKKYCFIKFQYVLYMEKQLIQLIKSSYNNNKLKISALTWNDKFELPDGSYSASDIQDPIILSIF